MNISEYILDTLTKYKLSIDNILYVVYAIGDDYNSRIFYKCNINNFLDIASQVTTIFDINWPYDIKIVGNHFWLQFDSQGACILCKHPQNQIQYKNPTLENLIRFTIEM